MKDGYKLVLAVVLGASMAQVPARAADKPAFKDEKAKVGYAIGINLGRNLKYGNYDIDLDQMMAGIKDVLAGRNLKLTPQEAQMAIMSYRREVQEKIAAKNRNEGDAFLAANKEKPGVKVTEVKLPNGKSVEMQYKILTKGTGPVPKPTDLVRVNYRGTTIDGKEFDSTAKHGGQPSKFPVTGMIRGWTAALEMMPVGSKWEIYVPSSLAYGDYGRGPAIQPGATLIFDIELLGIATPTAPPAKAQPLTSDIIKVPSAEDLKKGAKIQVIPAAEAAKMAKEAAQKAK